MTRRPDDECQINPAIPLPSGPWPILSGHVRHWIYAHGRPVAGSDFLNSGFTRHSSFGFPSASLRCGLSLGEDLLHHPPVNVGQPKIPAGVPVSELFVVKAEQMQERRVQIVDVNLVFDRLESEFVRGSVNRAAFDAAA